MGQVMDKQTLRKSILGQRDGLDAIVRERADSLICSRVCAYISEKKIKNVLTYVSVRSEADTYGLMDFCFKNHINVYVPRVSGRDMDFYRISSLHDLESGYMKIPEPVAECPVWNETGDEKENGEANPDDTIIILPGAVYDRGFYRIGYGGGFYDRYLKRHPGITAAGICYGFQIIDSIPRDEWDIPVNMIFSDDKFLSRTV